MTLKNPYQAYQKQAVTTAKPEELTLMLFEGLVKFIRLSKLSLQNNDLQESHNYNLRAQDIMSELIVTLNTDFQVSETILPLYEYMKSRLIEANMKKSVEILNEVEGLAVEFVETWSAAMKLAKTKS